MSSRWVNAAPQGYIGLMSDIYQDEFISPLVATFALPQQAQHDAVPENLVSLKKNSVFADLFQVAQDGHLTKQSASPVRDLAEKESPFTRTSPYHEHFSK